MLASCHKTNNVATIRIGSKDFTENLVISEIYALALEDAGYNIERMQNIAGSLVHNAIINNEIDVYPEYTGTALLTILQKELITDPEEVYAVVKEAYSEQFKITWLDYANVNDSAGLVIRTAKAKEYNIKTISDLQRQAEMFSFASQGEFDVRDDGLPLLEKMYGQFKWKSSKVYDNGLKYEILKNKEADVIPAYTTEGELVDTNKYLVLVDDKHIWPPYNVAPVVRNNVLETYPELADILNNIASKLDNPTIIRLNAEVDIAKREYEDVAREFLNSLK